MIARMIALLVFGLVCMTVGSDATALCIEGRIPLAEEFSQSRLVAKAVLIREHQIVDPADPTGVTATRYDFASKLIYKGKEKKFSVWIDNTSSRVVFSEGSEYLVFVQRGVKDGFVDACGNSGLVKSGAETIEWLKRQGTTSR